MQKKYWNTVYIGKEIEKIVLLSMIDFSYIEVVKKLKKVEKKMLGL